VTLPELLKKTVEMQGSDLHITISTPPQVRVHGHLQRLEGAELAPSDTKALTYSVLTDSQKKRFEESLELDFSFGIKGLARFRCNMFNQRGAVAAVYRLIPEKIRTFQELGLPAVLAALAERPRGLVLVTGPTGSGKSTTLAAMIDKINQERKDHILTIEDPIEYIHPHKGCLVNQREVHSDTQSFTMALRAALREDPDVVLIGELRDLETVEAALRIAETGHLTFGTLHTNDAPSTVNRLMNMGIEPFLVASSLNLVCAQRLVRRICKNCSEPHPTPGPALIQAGFTPEDAQNVMPQKGNGCEKCNNTGYKGRVGLYEVMEVTDELRELVLVGASALELRRKAIDDGMITLRQSGLRKVKEGMSTLEEVARETVK
jgi:pilus retraction protein PilT